MYVILAISYNRPSLSSLASWNSTAITFANINSIGWDPYGIFINSNNTVYIASSAYHEIQVWPEGSSQSIRNISTGSSIPYSLFTTVNGDIYVGYQDGDGRVDKWTSNASNSIPVMYATGGCSGLFIDIYNYLYCSISNFHQIVSRSLDQTSYETKIVAGTGCGGQLSDQLLNPIGIFVDTNFDLYVADSGNNRIQRFQSGRPYVITVAGGTQQVIGIPLSAPTAVVLDGDSNLFIVDTNQNRIVGPGPTGLQCIAGCSGSGLGSDQLSQPSSMAFDSYGNIYVADTNNSRIQMFPLASNFPGKYFAFH